jgi:hypothetical protein
MPSLLHTPALSSDQGCPQSVFSEEAHYFPPPSVTNYHQTLFKGTDGQMLSNILRLSLLGGPPRSMQHRFPRVRASQGGDQECEHP